MKSPRWIRIFAAPVMVLASGVAAPALANAGLQNWASVDVLTQQIATALGRQAAPIDRRIKLARCPEAPLVTASDSNSLAVRCPSLGWRLRVAMLRAGAGGGREYYFTPTAQSARERQAPPVVRRGDVVQVSIETSQYSIRYPATAMQEARVGESISLRGSDPKNSIVATITGPGRAVIQR